MRPGDVPAGPVTTVTDDDLLLDVREDDEWVEGHAPSARHVPMYDVPERLHDLPRDRPIAVICRSGNRSAYVAEFLVAHGFDARNVEGGMLAWQRAGRPVVSGDGR